MSSKGEQTRVAIRAGARRLFAANGYAGVTMQDICDVCDLSRGGLYRHYVSTAEIFLAILEEDQQEALASLRQAKENGVPAAVIFRTFVQNRIQTSTHPQSSIENAVTEFAACDTKGRYMLRKRGEASIGILTEIICRGNQDGDFCCPHPEAMAKHVLWMIEGMIKHSLLMPLTKEEIGEQIAFIEELLH